MELYAFYLFLSRFHSNNLMMWQCVRKGTCVQFHIFACHLKQPDQHKCFKFSLKGVVLNECPESTNRSSEMEPIDQSQLSSQGTSVGWQTCCGVDSRLLTGEIWTIWLVPRCTVPSAWRCCLSLAHPTHQRQRPFLLELRYRTSGSFTPVCL